MTVRRCNKPDKTGLSVRNQDEIRRYSSGCMVMQTVKIYRARFRWFFGFTATTFARLTPEAPPVPYRRYR
ncbi:hypothetical protein F4S22_23845 [Salmonella enterica subsp. enterica serovar Reading]|nr:hypothetical protein [Salmonella enterica]ECD2237081.1 hypothetical protein [Salmonella enterica subsp. enterica serovar Offa]EDH1180198.1 hypothetical protein [Salmonella enterica subsp. enterica serovar Enteritidis]EDJ6413273.1 hypothetical protein [Salmonella enterica subsp. enterica serovar Senftenberg]EDP1236069.1 hypothetical protein [Salmonella enterica subsp. enterica serovar Reading]EDV1125598.1 hypothetical protein [Salmonella enterica subsp. enterica]